MNIIDKFTKASEDIVFVYTICGNIEEARSMGYSAIREKHAISMDYWNINSIYPWQGVIQEINQFMLMFSTKKRLSDNLIKHIESEHSYKIPMIVTANIDMSNVPYSLWMNDVLNNEEGYITESEQEAIKIRESDEGFNTLK